MTRRKACLNLRRFRAFGSLGDHLGWYANGLLIGLTLWVANSNITAAVESLPPEASASSNAGELGPRIHFENPIFDFGELRTGESAKHSFVFTNTGDQVLEIKDVRPSCGCTTAGAWDQQVEPGKTGAIPIRFESGNFSGAIGKTVIVICNDPLQTNIVLQLKGTIWKPIELTPAFVVFTTTTDAETNETRLVRIASNTQEPFDVSPPECTNKTFRTALKTVQAGKEYELGVTFVGPLAPGSTTAAITLKTTSTNVPVITVMACAIVQGSVVATPAKLALPASGLAADAQMNVEIRNNGSRPLTLSEPSLEAVPGVVRLQEVEPGRQFFLTVNFPAGARARPGQPAEIRIKTSHPQVPVLKIPVVEGHSLAATLGESAPTPPAAKPSQQD